MLHSTLHFRAFKTPSQTFPPSVNPLKSSPPNPFLIHSLSLPPTLPATTPGSSHTTLPPVKAPSSTLSNIPNELRTKAVTAAKSSTRTPCAPRKTFRQIAVASTASPLISPSS